MSDDFKMFKSDGKGHCLEFVSSISQARLFELLAVPLGPAQPKYECHGPQVLTIEYLEIITL